MSRIVLRRTKSRRRDTPKLHTPTRLGDSKHPLSFLWRSSARALRRTTLRYFVGFFKSTLLHSGRIVSLAPIPTSGKDQIPPTISSWWQQTSSAFSSAFVHPFPPETGRSNSPRKKQIHHSPSRPSQPTAFFLPSGNYIPAILSAGTPSSRAGPISVGSNEK
jgi:hypothetical protein